MSLIYTADSSVSGGRRHSLYIGGKADAKNRDKLEQRGITHILNVTPTKDSGIQSGVPNFFEKSGKFVYKRVPVYDASTSDLLDYADSVVDFIAKGLYHGSVLVHCNHGVSRSTTCALFFLVRRAKLSLTDALAMVRRRRPEAEPIPAFWAQLERYESRCIQERSSEPEPKSGKNKVTLPDKKRQLEPARGPKTSSNGEPGTQKRSKMGPSVGPRSIGPAMPPSQKTVGPASRIPVSDDGKEAQDDTKQRRPIGPTLPPSAQNSVSSKPTGRTETP